MIFISFKLCVESALKVLLIFCSYLKICEIVHHHHTNMPLITYLSNFFNQSTTESTTTTHPPLERGGNNQYSGDIPKGNLVWFEDFGVGGSEKVYHLSIIKYQSAI